ncbi:MAG: pyruvate, phosphate dikinase [Anaerolineae bacterium]|nr:pyruvate, phosphate dikinase [Anaerolineae bacterium]
MVTPDVPIEQFIDELRERAKELNCLYKIQDLLNRSDISINNFCQEIVEIIPQGWQYPEICKAELSWHNKACHTSGFRKTPWALSADINVQGQVIGKLSVYYTEERPECDEGPFLKEERKLINTIAEQIGFFILHQQLKEVFEKQLKAQQKSENELEVILNLLRTTEPDLLLRVTRKMINYLFWQGIGEASQLLEKFNPAAWEGMSTESNRPFQQQTTNDMLAISSEVFSIADKYITRNIILENIQKWIKEERSSFLVDTLINPSSSLSDISLSIERYRALSEQGIELPPTRAQWLNVTLIRRILSDQPSFVDIAKHFITIDTFKDLLEKIIHPANSHGKLGGKGSGLFLASQIIQKSAHQDELLQRIKTPRTWYISSDGVMSFINYNNMEDVIEQKYKDLGQVRQEYPYIAHLFKNSPFSPEIVKGLSIALDYFGDVPLIVRSSSLLEDQVGMAFAGKYKSLFIANKGTKEERLAALMDAIAEVYASLFGPDPIEYRAQHGLMDYHEEMGILIQEVVGKQIGQYYLPAYAGVAFSNNEFRWSSRIHREDGLVRLVPGLGTRAVDRLSDDYPVLIAPGQPGLRVNVTTEEIIYYSPKKADVIDLKNCRFETVEIRTLLKECGRQYPLINQIVSVLKSDHIQLPSTIGMDFEEDNFIVTFEGLFTRTPFLKQIKSLLRVLQTAFNRPIDIEFAHDGTDFYLLQCRAQSFGEDYSAANIPKDIPREKVIFSANKYISNGRVPDITYIVYVDPIKYGEISSYQDLVNIGKIVSRLNQILPRRQFILMGPGRWGSRGDIKLGVSVTYSDINNTAMLIEIARKKKDYVPDLSFGTHFFQDLVEASIRYLPLYPDDPRVVFNENFLTGEKNLLAEILPDFAYLSDTVHVIDVPASTGGQILKVLMNAENEEAVAFLTEPSGVIELEEKKKETLQRGLTDPDMHWRWRLQAAERIAAQIDPQRFGVKNIYVFGSTKNATAGPQSDIDLLIHFEGTQEQRKDLLTWLEGWSLSLSHYNYLQTGMKTKGLLDVHIITDEDIKNRTSYASKIGAVTDAARPLAIGTDCPN